MGNIWSSHKGYRDEVEPTGYRWYGWFLPSEWRKFEEGGSWSDKKYAEHLMDDIVKAKVSLGEIEEINILLVGPVQSGKSSFINSVASIDKGRIARSVKAEKGGKSVTKQFEPYRPKDRLANFAIHDTIGVEDDANGLNVKDFMSVVKGNVYPFYKFNPVSPIEEDHKMFNKTPSTKDKMHCVVFVVDANVIGQEMIPDETRKKLKELQKALGDAHDITTLVVLTKIDILSTMVEKDIAKTYQSLRVKTAVELAEEIFGVRKANIFPVKNYSTEVTPDIGIDISILMALRQMILGASGVLESHSRTYTPE